MYPSIFYEFTNVDFRALPVLSETLMCSENRTFWCRFVTLISVELHLLHLKKRTILDLRELGRLSLNLNKLPIL